eukprot:gene6111-18218_t
MHAAEPADLRPLPGSFELCPVAGCLHAAPMPDFPGWAVPADGSVPHGLCAHLREHGTGLVGGAAPAEWLRVRRKVYCRGHNCGKLLSSAGSGVCDGCRAQRRAADLGLGAPAAALPHCAALEDLPTLEELFTRQPPTLKHVPGPVRADWGRLLRRQLALAEEHRSEAAWTELLMLAPCVLSPPKRAGKAHAAQAAAWTASRIARWDAGERRALWEDIPPPQTGGRGQPDGAARPAPVELCRDGQYSKALRALTDPGAVERD